MPTLYCETHESKSRRKKEAEKQVRAKYPCLIEGSSGWYRAVDNRMKRI